MAIKHIVCIDDDDNILQMNKKLLEDSGKYEVTCFTSGADALSNIKALAPDLILLDMMMPGMDGIAVIERLKKDPEMRSIPVIFMTAQKAAADVKKYMDLGALSVITKPIDMEDFPFQMELLSKILLTK